MSAPSSPETEYLSFSEDSDNEQPVAPSIVRSIAVAHTESPTTRALLCLNAARILLLETSRTTDKANNLKPFRQANVLNGIVSLGRSWNAGEIEDLDDILELPIFASSLHSVKNERDSCTLQHINDIVRQLQRKAASAVVEGINDTITVVGLPAQGRHQPRTHFIVFNPRCRSSLDLDEASLRFFPSVGETARHMFDLLNISRIATSDSQSQSLYNAHIFTLGDDLFGNEDRMNAIYRANIRLLQETLLLESYKSREDSIRREMKNTEARLGQIESEMRVTSNRKEAILRAVEDTRRNLDDTESMTATLLGEGKDDSMQADDDDVEMKDLTISPSRTQQTQVTWNVKQKTKASSWTTSSNATHHHPMNTDSDMEIDNRAATPDTPVDTLWNREQEIIKAKEERERAEKAAQELARLQAQREEEELSMNYIRQLEMEEAAREREYEALKEANKSFECPVCIEEYHQSAMSKAERCEHIVCRDCMLAHVKSQIEEAHWPIFCPMCPPSQEKRGVVTRRIAELCGGDDDLFVSWNRMELGSVSIALECPRCRETTRVDSEDFRETKELSCPLGCGAYWCKDCHQEIERNKKHSCDGQEEFNELAKQEGLKPCPGCGAMAERISGCNQLSCRTPGCNTHFCYACGGLIAKSIQELGAAKSRHYQTCKLF